MNSITDVTPTICSLMEIDLPELSTAQPIDEVLRVVSEGIKPGKIEKCLIFCPDAIGSHIIERFPEIFDVIERIAGLKIPMRSVLPPKTPVCFASMFTGASPERHGIKHYERPILVCDTIFDSLILAGKRVAIVAHTASSIDLIFRSRAIEYHSEVNDELVTERVLTLLEDNQHDVILAYQQQYDDILHRSRHDSHEALEALKMHVEAFRMLSEVYEKNWSESNRMILFAPDHGAHFDEKLGKSNHSEDIPEDMEVYHFYGFKKGEKQDD